MAAATDFVLREKVQPMMAPVGKVRAASLGAALGGAVGTIASWVIAAHYPFGPDAPGLQVLTPIAITALSSGLFAAGAGWLKRPDLDIRIVCDEENRPRTARRRMRRA